MTPPSKSGILESKMKKSQPVKATPSPKLTVPSWWWLPVLLGGFNAALALAQLADFEGFVSALETYNLTSGSSTVLLAIIIAAVEILSLPVLFRLSLSPAMRAVSVVSVVLVPLAWLKLSTFAAVGGAYPRNAGYFGELLPQPFSWWHTLGMLIIVAGALYALHILGGRKLLQK